MRKILIAFVFIFTIFTITGCKNATTKEKTTSAKRSTVELLESDLENQITYIAEYLDNATFCVLNYSTTESENASSLGSGVVYKRTINSNDSYTYYLVTNRHVIEDGEKFKVYTSSGSTMTANVLGYSTTVDIGVLTFTSYEKYNVVPFASIDDVKQGESCFAMGTPLYMQYVNTFTKGNVSGIRSQVIQHTADINAGNSGGPLVNLNGELIGINVSKLSTNQMGQADIDGMCMAIRCDLVEQAIDEIEGKNNATINPLLGMTVTDIDSVKAYDYDSFDDLWNGLKNEWVTYYTSRGYSEQYALMKFNDNYGSKKTDYEESYNELHAFNVYLDSSVTKGMMVRDVVIDSVSYKADVKIGDVVVKINDKEIENQTDFAIEFYKYGIGDTFTITVNRLGEVKTLTITL